jgi:glycolate oxidase iron-sulfur subunit
MEKKKFERDFHQLAQKCLRCGLCTMDCPVHQVEADEYTAARGRNLLANGINGKKDFNKQFRQRFEKCLLCGTCLPKCPQQIPIDRLTISVREEMVRTIGLGLAKHFAFRYAMKDRARFGKILTRASKYQKYLPGGEGKIRHLPAFLSILNSGRRLPEIAPVFLRDRLSVLSSPEPEKRKGIRIGFFMGCAIDFIYPEIGQKIVRFLNDQGVEVLVPREQGCCALPLIGSGDLQTAQEMAQKNLEAFGNVDLVVTGCATCGSALKDYGTFFEGGEIQFDSFAAKVRDFSEFLIRDLKLSPEDLSSGAERKGNLKVTYHDPCHLSRYQGIKKEPRQVISALPGVQLVEMDGADQCCGMGGSFGLSYYDVSKKIADKKASAIRKTGADAVVTTCPGCRMQLLDTLNRHGLPQRVVHLAELLLPDGGKN